MPATRNMSVRNPARAKRLASARATPEPRRRVREAPMALGARVRGPREVFLRAIVSRARRKIRYSPENETARFPRWGQTTQLSSRGSANRREPRDGACGATQTNSIASLARRALGVGALSVGEGENFDGDDGKRLRNSQE